LSPALCHPYYSELQTVLQLYPTRRSTDLLDLGTGQSTELLVSTQQHEASAGEISPDGTRAIINVATPWREGTNLSMAPAVMDMQSGQLQDLWPQLDRWVTPAWLTNTQLVAATDDEGAGAMYVGGVDALAP